MPTQRIATLLGATCCVRLAGALTAFGTHGPGTRFSKAPESFRARKAIFRSSVSKNGEVYTSETYCMKGNPLHL